MKVLPVLDFNLDASSGVPIWVQIRQRIIFLIESGEIEPGSQLPTVRGLAAQLSVNYNTVNKAYLSLSRDGYINSTRGRGAFVNKGNVDADGQNPTQAMAREYVQACLDEGMGYSDIRAQVNQVIAQIQRTRKEQGNSSGAPFE